jgi:hypothetical protein
MLMTGAPGDFDAVNLVVTEIAIHRGLVDSLAVTVTAQNVTDLGPILLNR